mgnify:CR=1 FL=1
MTARVFVSGRSARNGLWGQVNLVFMRLTAYCVLGERIDPYRKTGLALILLGALFIVG